MVAFPKLNKVEEIGSETSTSNFKQTIKFNMKRHIIEVEKESTYNKVDWTAIFAFGVIALVVAYFVLHLVAFVNVMGV